VLKTYPCVISPGKLLEIRRRMKSENTFEKYTSLMYSAWTAVILEYQSESVHPRASKRYTQGTKAPWFPGAAEKPVTNH
jgi:hypothetical protein